VYLKKELEKYKMILLMLLKIILNPYFK